MGEKQELSPLTQALLLRHQLPLACVLISGVGKGFSQSQGENAKFCDGAYLLQPLEDPEAEFGLTVQVEGPLIARDLEQRELAPYYEWATACYASEQRKLKQQSKHRSVLIGYHEPGETKALELTDSLDELEQLAKTLDYTVVERWTQNRLKPHPVSYLGRGKAESLALWVQQHHVDQVIANDQLSPIQVQQLEKLLGLPVLDRTGLILDIFARRAQSSVGKLQVELAQLQYEIPRLRGSGSALSQQVASAAKAMTASRGPGETQSELMRRALKERMQQVKKNLKQVQEQQHQQRRARMKDGVVKIALVGYTNAGKSTLMKQLTRANVLAEDQLFATLEPTTRQLWLSEERTVLVSDTVGFIQKLPTFLIKAFQTTLQEALHADLLLLVWDLSHPHRKLHLETVQDTLKELEIDETPCLLLCNKVDQNPEATTELSPWLEEKSFNYEWISALNPDDMDKIKTWIMQQADALEEARQLEAEDDF